MWRDVAWDQVRVTLRSPLLYLFAAFMGLQAFQFASNTVVGRTTAFAINGLWHNSPYVIARYLIFMSVFAFVFVTVLVGPAVVRDFRHRSHEFFFTSGVGRQSYLIGRFLGAFVPSLMIYGVLVVGFLLGVATLPADFVGPHSFRTWAVPVAVSLLPNLTLVAVVFFSIAALTRRLIWTYVLSVVVLIGYAIVTQLTPGESSLAALLDPFGLAAFDHATALWTRSERNGLGYPMTGLLVANRALWTSVTVAVAAFTLRRFPFTSILERRRGTETAVPRRADPTPVRPLTTLRYPEVRSGRFHSLSALIRLAASDVRAVATHPGFLVLTAIGLAQLTSNLTSDLGANGSRVYPTTSVFLAVAPRHIAFYILAITVFFTPTIVWRERDHRSAPLFDSMPLSNGVFWGAKGTAILALQTGYMGLATVACILIQLFAGGVVQTEPGLYLSGFFGFELLPLWMLGIAVAFVQVVSPSKSWGIALGALVVLSDTLLANLGVQESLYRYASHPGYIYSDMNGFGHFLAPVVWHLLYWGMAAGLLVIAGNALWTRGHGRRLGWAGTRFAGRTLSGFFVAAFFGCGMWIYYNTHILNDYRRTEESTAMRAAYERRYGELRLEPRLSLQHVELTIDVRPLERAVTIGGVYTLRNETDAPQDRTLITLFPFRRPEWRRLDGAAESTADVEDDAETGVRIVRFHDPLEPGETGRIEFEVAFRNHGFAATDLNNEIVENGTYVDGLRAGWYLPIVGYEYHLEIVSEEIRREFGLGPRPSLPDPASPEARRLPSQGGDRTTFDITVSTDADQTPLGPGDQVYDGVENGRRVARFRGATPVTFGSLSFFSGRYDVLRDRHLGTDIEVYFHPGHEYNLDRMVRGVKRSLDYNREHFGPYPYEAVRIIEVPDLGTIGGTARALPGLMAWTETGGFLSDLSDPDALDVVFNTTTHEVAHQWWGHQLAPGMAPGSGALVETMAQWVRLKTLERELGTEVADEFRRAEMLRYLRSRAVQTTEEPLALSNDTGVLYRKGTVVMGALGETLGEVRVNLALRTLLERFAGSGSFPTTADLLAELRAVATTEEQSVITDLFERITLFDNAVVDVHDVTPEGSRYRVGFTVRVQKRYADGTGVERVVPAHEWIELAILDENEVVIHTERMRFTGGFHPIELVVDRPPAFIEVDPRTLLIDRDLSDNRRGVRPARDVTPDPLRSEAQARDRGQSVFQFLRILHVPKADTPDSLVLRDTELKP